MTQVTAPARPASMTRIPSLDGLRALSIFLVMALHTLQPYSIGHHASPLWYAIFDGDTGVYIFFVISGYLITRLLLNEHQKRGSISFRGFYVRRAMRILPPLYAYVAALLLLGWAGRLALDKIDIFSALFFFHNYAHGFMWQLEHFWSLSIEEQFYFIWPLVLFFCLRRPELAGRALAARVALGVILVSPAVRVISFLVHNRYIHDGTGFHMRADMLMFGCAAALLEGTPRFERFYGIATKVWWLPPAIIFFSGCIEARFQNYWTFPFGFTLSGAAIAIFLLWCVRNPASRIGRALNARFVVHIGVISYSIYLWQTLFLHEGGSRIFGPVLGFLCVFPANWVAILAVAELSRYLVELPSLRLRDRLIKTLHFYTDVRRAKQQPA